MPSRPNLLRRAVRGAAGLALGGALSLVEIAFLIFGNFAAIVAPFVRPGYRVVANRLVALNRRRLVAYLGFEDAVEEEPEERRAVFYLVARSGIGLVGVGIFALTAFGMVSAAILVAQAVVGAPLGGGDPADVENDPFDLVTMGVLGLVLLFVAVWGLIGVAVVERGLAQHYLGPSAEELLRRRVSQLSTTRAGVVEAVNDERRRIERDLHDGVQQRLVALGMLLGRARRAADPAHASDLLRQAHEASQTALVDLREVTWRVYPIALDEGGLHTALEAVAERSAVPVRLSYGLAVRPSLALETVAYFVASEAVTNALKHGDPSTIGIDVSEEGSEIVVRVRDDGVGGARPAGTGLSGLARRVAAADGSLHVESPAGGPTVITARLPCG